MCPCGDRVLISGLDLELRRGDRLGIVGPNGTGKTSLIATLLKRDACVRGSVADWLKTQNRVVPAAHEALDPSLVLWRHLQDTLSEGRDRDITEQEARTLLVRFLFSGTTQDKCVGDLPVANVRGWFSQDCLPPHPTCWCWMNRPTTWIFPRPKGSSRCWILMQVGRAPWCWSVTTVPCLIRCAHGC